MRIETPRLVVRDFERRDAEPLFRIVRETNIRRFMRDWSENGRTPASFLSWIDWLQTRSQSTNVQENKRYAVVLPDSDELIGMVGMGLEDTLGEVEAAWFLAEAHQGRGYATEAVKALAEWIFRVSDLPWIIATIDCANPASCRVAERAGFELFERRTPIGHRQPNMESDSYFYYRLQRPERLDREPHGS